MNAREERFAAATERAQPSPPQDEVGTRSPALTDGGGLEGNTLDYWLLSRLRSFLGDPPVEFAMANGARVGPSSCHGPVMPGVSCSRERWRPST